MLGHLGPHPYRPAHMHFKVTAPRHETTITNAFVAITPVSAKIPFSGFSLRSSGWAAKPNDTRHSISRWCQLWKAELDYKENPYHLRRDHRQPAVEIRQSRRADQHRGADRVYAGGVPWQRLVKAADLMIVDAAEDVREEGLRGEAILIGGLNDGIALARTGSCHLASGKTHRAVVRRASNPTKHPKSRPTPHFQIGPTSADRNPAANKQRLSGYKSAPRVAEEADGVGNLVGRTHPLNRN